VSGVEQALAELDASRRRLLSELEGLDEAHFVRQPDTGGWSAAQAAEHIARVEEAIGRGIALAAAGKLPIKFRLSDILGRLIWKFGVYKVVRVRAMTALVPEKSLPRAETLARLARNREILLSVVQSVPLAGLRLRHPVFGPFSGAEMVQFASLHEERHRLQIVRIKRAIGVR
jgi:uncharacterized damage-inducible protein DinB